MEHNTIENKSDFSANWVSSSRFLFYITIFCLVAFLFAGSCNLYQHRYKGKPDVVVPDNTLYNPKYK